MVQVDEYYWSAINPYTYIYDWIIPFLSEALGEDISENFFKSSPLWKEAIDQFKKKWPPTLIGNFGRIQGLENNPYDGKVLFNPYFSSGKDIFQKKATSKDSLNLQEVIDLIDTENESRLLWNQNHPRSDFVNHPFLVRGKTHSNGWKNLTINFPLIISKQPIDFVEDDEDWAEMLAQESLGFEIFLPFYKNKLTNITVRYNLLVGSPKHSANQNNYKNIISLKLPSKKIPFMNWNPSPFKEKS
jgi:hypothetical protein